MEPQGRASILRYSFLLIMGTFVEEAWEECPEQRQSLLLPVLAAAGAGGQGDRGVTQGLSPFTLLIYGPCIWKLGEFPS